MSASSRSLEEKVTVKTLIWVAILSAVLTFISTMWHAFLPYIARCNFTGLGVICSEPAEMVGMPFVLLMLLFPFALKSSWFREKFGVDKLTYMYVVAFTVAGFSNVLMPWCNFPYYACSRGNTATTNPLWKAKIPEFVAVPPEVADATLLGGVTEIPWGVWLAPMLWFFVLISSFGVISLAVANILRKSWIDIERVPFPHTLLAYESLIQVQGGDRAKAKLKPFLLGILVGIIVSIPLGAIMFLPWFPDVYAWRTATCGPGAQQITSDSPLYSQPIALHFTKHPIAYVIAYMLPLDVLFSTWLFTLIYVIIVYVAFYSGYYTALPTTGSCGRIWCGDISPLYAPPLRLRLISGGGILGLILMTLFLERKHILQTLRAAFGRMSPDEKAAIEKDEPLSYKSSWIMLIIGFIVLWGLLVGTGFDIAQGFAMVLLSTILWIGQTRLFGLTGVHIESSGAVQWITRAIWYPEMPYPGEPPTSLVLGSVMWSAQSNRHPLDGWGWSMWSSFSAYQMGRLTGVHAKNVFKVVLIALLVAQFVSLPTVIVGLSYYGMSRLHGASSLWASNLEWWASTGWFVVASGPPAEWIGHIIVGAIALAAMTYIHARVLWFPHPLGPILAWSMSFPLFGWWLSFLVAWVLKMLTLRIGGSRAYEEIGVPFAGGVLGGYAIVNFVFALIGVVRFFVPF